MLEINKFRSSEKKKTIDGCCFLNLTRPSPWDAKNTDSNRFQCVCDTSHLAMCFSTRPEGTMANLETNRKQQGSPQALPPEGSETGKQILLRTRTKEQLFFIWGFLKWGYTSKSSILIGFSIRNHPAITPMTMEPPMTIGIQYIYKYIHIYSLHQRVFSVQLRRIAIKRGDLLF